MKIIQIIGLPCSGKSTAIKSYIEKNKNINYIDIASYSGPNKFNTYKRNILKSSGNIIAESANGVAINSSYVIKLDIARQVLYQRTLERDGILDESFISLLEKNMIASQYTVHNEKALHAILNALLGADKKCNSFVI